MIECFIERITFK